MIFSGVDIETTGLSADSQLIQIGVALGEDLFVYDVGHDLEDLNIRAEALKINGFTLDRLMCADYPPAVDLYLDEWLRARTEPGQIIPVGWNVGTFDMPFIRRTFPHAARYFHPYRSVDLNSICYAFSRIDSYDIMKRNAQQWACEQAGRGREHDAGYDARTSLLAFQWLQRQIQPTNGGGTGVGVA